MLDERLNLRLSPADLAAVATIAARHAAKTGTVFVTRSDAVRAAIRAYAATVPADAQPDATDAR